MKSKAFRSRLPIQHNLSTMVQKKQPKYLGNLIYFHCFYYHHITIALKSIYLSQPLSRSRSIFLNVTHLLEISIKCLKDTCLTQTYSLCSSYNYRHHLHTIPHFSLPPTVSHIIKCLSVLLKSNLLFFDSISFGPSPFLYCYNNCPASNLFFLRKSFSTLPPD